MAEEPGLTMSKEQYNNIFSTNYQKALKFLASHPGREFMESEVQAATGMSKAGTNQALRTLAANRLLEVEKKGRLSLFQADPNNPLIRQIKVLITLSIIDEFVASIKEMSDRIILFGSAASGMDAEESDIDLFVLTHDPEAVRKNVRKFLAEKKVHLVARKPLDYIAPKKKDKVFYDEVSHGIVLYERPS